MEVLQQGIAQEVVVSGRPDDRGDRRPARLLGCAVAALTHDELVVARKVRPATHDDGLEDTDLTDAGDQLIESVLIEDIAGLPGIGSDEIKVDLTERRAGDRDQLILADIVGRIHQILDIAIRVRGVNARGDLIDRINVSRRGITDGLLCRLVLRHRTI